VVISGFVVVGLVVAVVVVGELFAAFNKKIARDKTCCLLFSFSAQCALLFAIIVDFLCSLQICRRCKFSAAD